VLWQREEAAAQEEKFREVLIERGMTFTPISDEVRAELREATSGVVDGLRERIGDEPIDLVLANMGS
jgi:TRAP-type C4-dicarboxylate transport system substrate-binding protein